MQTCVETCLCTIWSWRHVESSRSHVGRTDGLNLLHSAEFWLGQQLRAQEEKSPLYYIYKKQEIAVAFSQTLAFSSAFPATLEHNNQVWLLLKKKQQGKVIFFFFVFSFFHCDWDSKDDQYERSLPHQSLLWSRWEDGDTPVPPYWHQTQYKTLWSLGWRRTSHTPTRMTDDKGPGNEREEDNGSMGCIDLAQVKEIYELNSSCWTMTPTL